MGKQIKLTIKYNISISYCKIRLIGPNIDTIDCWYVIIYNSQLPTLIRKI